MLALVAAVAGLSGALCAQGATPEREPGSGSAKVATSGNHSELIETIPIRRRIGRWRTTMALAPPRLPRLRETDRLRVSAVGAVAREPVVGDHPGAADPLEIGVQARDPLVVRDCHVGLRVASHAEPAALRQLEQHELAVGAPVFEERPPAPLGGDAALELGRSQASRRARHGVSLSGAAAT